LCNIVIISDVGYAGNGNHDYRKDDGIRTSLERIGILPVRRKEVMLYVGDLLESRKEGWLSRSQKKHCDLRRIKADEILVRLSSSAHIVKVAQLVWEKSDRMMPST